MPCLLELDRAVSCLKLSRLYLTRTGATTFGTGLSFSGREGGLRRCLFTKEARHLTGSLMGALLNGREAERSGRLVNAEEFLGNRREKLLETRVLRRIG
jgi:hypothetical protein